MPPAALTSSCHVCSASYALLTRAANGPVKPATMLMVIEFLVTPGTGPPGAADAVVALVDTPPLDDDALDAAAPRAEPLPVPLAPGADAPLAEPPAASVAPASDALPDASPAAAPADAPTRLALTNAVSWRGAETEQAPATSARATMAMRRFTRTTARRRRPAGTRASGTQRRPAPGRERSCRARRPACSSCSRATAGPWGRRTRPTRPYRRGRTPLPPGARCSRPHRGRGCRWAS